MKKADRMNRNSRDNRNDRGRAGVFAQGRDSILRRIVRLQVSVGSDRGDVPGWVLVTVMTAGLVTALWMVADDQLTAILTKAINSVTK